MAHMLRVIRAQVMVHKDSIDSSAFFLYRKLPAKPLEPAVLLSGPPVEASDDQMSVRDLYTLRVTACKAPSVRSYQFIMSTNSMQKVHCVVK